MTSALDIAVTWPKVKPLDSYYAELVDAQRDGLLINFRLPSRPQAEPERCYHVHDGYVRCWCPVVEVRWRESQEVRDPVSGGWWPEGWYVVRRPSFTEIQPVRMRGFQGFRYLDDRSRFVDRT